MDLKTLERFVAKVDFTTSEQGCWVWTGAAIDLATGTLRLDETKNGERRLVPVTGLALDLLRGLTNRGAGDPVFPGDFRTAWGVACRRAGLVDFRFHDLRHTAASYLAMSGASLAEIAEVLGHKSLAMTKRYTHLSTDHTRKVVSKLTERLFGGQ